MLQWTGEVIIRMLADVQRATIEPLSGVRSPLAAWLTPTSMRSATSWPSGATSIELYAMPRGSMVVVMMAMASARSATTR